MAPKSAAATPPIQPSSRQQISPARDDGSLLIDGGCPVDELGDRLGILVPADHSYHTVAGFVLDQMKRLPRIGESFNYGLWRFEVVDIDGTRIDKLLATPQPTLHRRA